MVGIVVVNAPVFNAETVQKRVAALLLLYSRIRGSAAVERRVYFHGVFTSLSSFVGRQPDMLPLRRGDELIPEIRVGDGDERLRALPTCSAPRG